MEHSAGWWAAYAALRKIRTYPANGNSEPDTLADAIENIYRLAREALAQMDAERGTQ